MDLHYDLRTEVKIIHFTDSKLAILTRVDVPYFNYATLQSSGKHKALITTTCPVKTCRVTLCVWSI